MENTKTLNTENTAETENIRNTPEIKILDRIYKNSRMGSQSLIDLMSKIKDEDFRSDITVQITGYESYASKAGQMLKDAGVKPEDENFLTKAGAKFGMVMNTMTDSTTSHLAEMVVQGSTMGITDLTHVINEYENSDEVKDGILLAKEVVRFEEHNLTKMKKYL